MTAVRVEDRVTRLSVPDLLGALAAGYRIVMGGGASAPELATLGAQVCLETGRGQAMHCWNPGNVKLPADWDGLFTSYGCDEVFDAQTARLAQRLGPCTVNPWKGGPLQHVILPASHPWARFLAFGNASDGMADYVDRLSGKDRYRAAWTLAHRGDPDGFSRALAQAGYYTAPVDQYTRGLVALAAELMPVAKSTLDDAPTDFSEETALNVAAMVSASVANDLIWNHDRHEPLGTPEEYPLV